MMGILAGEYEPVSWMAAFTQGNQLELSWISEF